MIHEFYLQYNGQQNLKAVVKSQVENKKLNYRGSNLQIQIIILFFD